MSELMSVVASAPEYERLVVDVELDGYRFFRVSMEGDEPMGAKDVRLHLDLFYEQQATSNSHQQWSSARRRSASA